MSTPNGIIPFVVICYNNLTFCKMFYDQIISIAQEIIIIDNNSTYKNLLNYYLEIEKSCPIKITIHRLNFNYGHKVYLKCPHLVPKIFILSDPDLLLNPKMPKNVAGELLNISNKYKAYKVGLALDISDSEKFIEGHYGKLVYKIESSYYKKKIDDSEHTLYDAPLDTTFVLVNKNFESAAKNIRVGGDFTCKHLPWYNNWLKENIPSEELQHWVTNNKSSSILSYIDPTK